MCMIESSTSSKVKVKGGIKTKRRGKRKGGVNDKEGLTKKSMHCYYKVPGEFIGFPLATTFILPSSCLSIL